MPRGLTNEHKAALAARIKRIAVFIYINSRRPVAAWNGAGEIMSLGIRFQGAGQFISVADIEQMVGRQAQGVSIGLTGAPGMEFPTDAIAKTRLEQYRGKKLSIYYGLTDPETDRLLAPIFPVWTGVCDVLSFHLGETISATMTGEHLSSHLRRVNGNRMTSASHNARFGTGAGSADQFFDYSSRDMLFPENSSCTW
jgi:hypothetical protein